MTSRYPRPIGKEVPFTSIVSAVYDSILLTETMNDRCMRLKSFDGNNSSISLVLILEIYSLLVVTPPVLLTELKNFKQTFRSQSNAFYWASQHFWSETLNKKIFENNLHMNPLVAAKIYASAAVAAYDGFMVCFDAKYAYWGIRPNQYDTTYKSLVPTPPFPGYPFWSCYDEWHV